MAKSSKNVKNSQKTPKRKMWLNKAVLWKCDFDYISKLTPADRKWLFWFIQEYINAYPSKGKLHSKSLMRDCYTSKRKARNDIFNNAKAISDAILEYHDMNRSPGTENADEDQ